jgi:hypothetical protein
VHAIFHLFAITLKENVTKRQDLLVFTSFLSGFVFSSDQVQCSTSDAKSFRQKNKLPLRTYFLMLCSLVCFALAVDTALGFLPLLAAMRVDFACESLDFEEDAV